jgi:phage terminase large subunit GpA-like protein
MRCISSAGCGAIGTFRGQGPRAAARPVLGKPSDVHLNYRGVKIKRGAQVWLVGTDTAKSVVYGRLRVKAPGPGYMHYPARCRPTITSSSPASAWSRNTFAAARASSG